MTDKISKAHISAIDSLILITFFMDSHFMSFAIYQNYPTLQCSGCIDLLYHNEMTQLQSIAHDCKHAILLSWVTNVNVLRGSGHLGG